LSLPQSTYANKQAKKERSYVIFCAKKTLMFSEQSKITNNRRGLVMENAKYAITKADEQELLHKITDSQGWSKYMSQEAALKI